MRSLISIILILAIQMSIAQSVMDLAPLIGQKVDSVDLTLDLGYEIDTVVSGRSMYKVPSKGVVVYAHASPKRTPGTAVITGISFFFDKQGFESFSGELPFHLDPSKGWKKNEAALKHKMGMHVDVIQNVDVGLELKFHAWVNSMKVYYSISYLNDKKGLPGKKMYSLDLTMFEE